MFLKIVYWNYNDLKQTEISYNENIKYNSFHLGDEQLFNVLRYIHNYLSSTNMFIQQYGANVKRENPKLFDEFNEHRKDLYHKNLSYRLIWELRNELQHSKMPDLNIKFIKDKNNYFKMKIYIKKDFLLTINKLKEDDELKQLEENIDLFEHASNMNGYLIDLAKSVFLNELDEIIDHYYFLKNELNNIAIEGHPFIEKSFNNGNPEFTFFNIDFMKFIEDNIVKWCKF